MSKVKEIVVGWANLFRKEFDALPENVQKLADERFKICNNCPIRKGNVCDPKQMIENVVTKQMVNGCGCNLKAKVLSPESKCPASKW